jgi:hypothetical protein
MDYHGAKEEHILRYLTISQRDKQPEEHQPFWTGIHASVFLVASPFMYARYAQGLRLKYKRLHLPSNAQVIFNRALMHGIYKIKKSPWFCTWAFLFLIISLSGLPS